MRYKRHALMLAGLILTLTLANPTVTWAMAEVELGHIQQQLSSLWILLLVIPMGISAAITT